MQLFKNIKILKLKYPESRKINKVRTVVKDENINQCKQQSTSIFYEIYECIVLL